MYESVLEELRKNPKTWFVTGCAGFIGSALVETLLLNGQTVIGLDNFITGHKHNLDDVQNQVGAAWERFQFLEADINATSKYQTELEKADYVLHQAALGSVPRSIEYPLDTHLHNVTGFITLLTAAQKAGVSRFVYASSSSVYGDHPELPKREEQLGQCLSPYAVSKLINEQYADVYALCYGLESIGLRYFNVFGRRQDPNGAYAAVIPKWAHLLINQKPCVVFGDGSFSRDFCYVDNAVQANILAATTSNQDAIGQIFNVGAAGNTTLNELYDALRDALARHRPELATAQLTYGEPRAGDIPHSQASIEKIERLLGYKPSHSASEGLTETAKWYVENS